MLKRSYSEGDIFYNSWDYTNVDKSIGKNGVDLVLEFLHFYDKQTQPLQIPKTPEKKKKKKKNKKSVDNKENESDNLDNSGTFIITPRNNTANVQNVDYKDATMKINSEGRNIIEYATLDQVVKLFSEQSQGIYSKMILN